jgi:copper homeostasis protein CutC
MAGGTVRAENVEPLVNQSGVSHVHSRATDINVFRELVTKLRSFAPKPLSIFTPPTISKPEVTKPQ